MDSAKTTCQPQKAFLILANMIIWSLKKRLKFQRYKAILIDKDNYLLELGIQKRIQSAPKNLQIHSLQSGQGKNM